jgi:hypothetical protein
MFAGFAYSNKLAAEATRVLHCSCPHSVCWIYVLELATDGCAKTNSSSS